MERIAYFDCFSGAAGDMIVAALLDAGADADAVRDGLAALNVGGYGLDIRNEQRQGLAGTRFDVQLADPEKQPHRHLSHIVDILEGSSLPASVRTGAEQVFRRLAEAEAAVHGTDISKVHFHEVGAVDAIVDIVGALLALENLGVTRVECSTIPTGSGTVRCAHGVLPVPAPATARLLVGVPIEAGHGAFEMTTPTGAALLTTLAKRFGPLPAMTVESMGYGAGGRDEPGHPNLLRVLVGGSDVVGTADEIVVLQTNLDDCSPELIAHCLEELLAAGALDAYAVPITMKKSRSGVMLTALAEPTSANALERVIWRETTSFGIRRHTARRAKLSRRHEVVATPYGDVRMKIGSAEDFETAAPEFEDCRTAARQHGVAVRQVMQAASVAWAQRMGSSAS
jgi:uncharacterized protein (TIGR00299 family) protein